MYQIIWRNVQTLKLRTFKISLVIL